MFQLNFEDVIKHVNSICLDVEDSGFEFERVVAIVPGGELIGRMISEYFDVPLTCIHWGYDLDERECNCWLPEDFRDGVNTLVVTDIADDSILNSLYDDWMSSLCGTKNGKMDECVKYAAIYEKDGCDFTMDYYCDIIRNDIEVVMPWTQWWK